MKRSNRNKSIPSTASSALSTSQISPLSCDLDLFSSYSHEQVHIYDKLCSSISSNCEIAYCTSEGITICVPETSPRESSSSSNLSSSSSSMLVTRITYPFESPDQANPISTCSTSNLLFEKIKVQHLPRLYEAYKHRPTSLSSFDRLLCLDTTRCRGFRQCSFSPFDVTTNCGQSLLATVTCANEVFIYEIVSSSKRFFRSQSSILRSDLTKQLLENVRFEDYLIDSTSESDYRFLYFHLTSNILWNQTGTRLFQLQYSGHLIVWKFDGAQILNVKSFTMIDTKLFKPSLMTWSEDSQILLIVGTENQRVLIKLEEMKVQRLSAMENDHMNAEHVELVKIHQNTLILLESKKNYCLLHLIDVNDDQTSQCHCSQVDCHVFPSTVVGFHREKCSSSTSCTLVIVGCEDGTMYSCALMHQPPFTIRDVKLVAHGQMKSCSRKPLLLRHFSLSSNELLLARIFYSPIVAPNVKFGFVLCTLHRWASSQMLSFEKVVEQFLQRIDVPLYRSSDELAVIRSETQRNRTFSYQMKKSSNDDGSFLQRLCRFYSLTKNVKQLQILENQLLENYRRRLSSIFKQLFSAMTNQLSQSETLIFAVCCNDQEVDSTSLTCPLCNAQLLLTANDLVFCTCSNKHVWPRCCRTLLPLSLDDSATCSLCDRTITFIDKDDKNYNNFALYKDKQLDFLFSSICTYCL